MPPGLADAFLLFWFVAVALGCSHHSTGIFCFVLFFFKTPQKATILVALCASGDHGLSGGAASADANSFFGSFSD